MRFNCLKKRLYCYIYAKRLMPPTAVQPVEAGFQYTFNQPFEAPVAIIAFRHRSRLNRLLDNGKFVGMRAYIYDKKLNKPSKSNTRGNRHTHVFENKFSEPLEKFTI